MRKNTNSNISEYEMMTETPVQRLILRLSVPTVISMLITNIYNLVDTAFVGRLGTSASGAVGVVFGFMAIIQACGFLFGQGSGNLISRKLGQKDYDAANVIASTGFFVSLFFGFVIAVVCRLELHPIVMVLGSTDTIAPYAETYIRYILIATPFMAAGFTLNNILRYESKATLGTIGLMTGALLNIIGDPIFMFGFKMGIAGAGLSTCISQIISFLVLLGMFLRKKTTSRLSIRYISLKPSLMADIVTTGLPSLLRQGLNSVATILLNSFASVYGDAAVAAMSIVSRIIFFVIAFGIGIGQGFQPVCGFNYGAKKFGRVRSAYKVTIFMSETVLVIAAIIVLALSGRLIGIFRDDPEVIVIGIRALRIQGVALLAVPFCMSTEMMLQCTGRKVGASLLSSMRSGLFFIPILIILANLRGLYGIEESQAWAFVLSFVSALPFAVHFLRKMKVDEGS
ncbi:MAG: MATE family efflux transporter [Clostridiales bacterium]|nr:MATE family efflux transporter [Clostridiales bacterium]